MNHCLRHFEEPVVAHCRECHQPFCSRCLVYSFGPKKPPYCLGCALHASGVRNGHRNVVAPDGEQLEPVDKRALKAQRRAERDAEKQAAKAAKKAARATGRPAEPAPQQDAARTAQVPPPSLLLAQDH